MEHVLVYYHQVQMLEHTQEIMSIGLETVLTKMFEKDNKLILD